MQKKSRELLSLAEKLCRDLPKLSRQQSAKERLRRGAEQNLEWWRRQALLISYAERQALERFGQSLERLVLPYQLRRLKSLKRNEDE